MRVLLVSNQHPNPQGIGNPIVLRMMKAIEKDVRVENVVFFPFHNSIHSLLEIRKYSRNYDIVHVHFGGLYTLGIWLFLIGRKCKKIITFHGTDIHAKAIVTTKGILNRLKIRINQWSSFLDIVLYDKCGFVATDMLGYIPQALSRHIKMKSFHNPLGVDYSLFTPMKKEDAQDYLGLDHKRYALFSDISGTPIKRKDIAESIISLFSGEFILLVMSGVKPKDVPYYINACDFVILTSDEEGSPNIIREALSLNKPIFSVDVGDAARQLAGLTNSTIISRNSKDAAATISHFLRLPYIDNTRDSKRDELDFDRLSRIVVDLYVNSIDN